MVRLALPALLLLLVAAAHADDDHERAREALARGEVRPLAEILEGVGNELGGEIVGVEFEGDDGRFVYEFEVVMPDGRLREVQVDAASGVVLRSGVEN